MWRYLVGLVAGVLLVAGGLLWWRSTAIAHAVLPDAPQASADTPSGDADAPLDPPAASAKTREEKRFSRYDHDKNGLVSRDEFLAQRRRAFAKLDTNGDGRLSFDEYAIKTETKFAGADRDKSATLNPTEFATTRVIRKIRAAPRCAPAERRESDEG